jgi:hypothetical protein
MGWMIDVLMDHFATFKRDCTSLIYFFKKKRLIVVLICLLKMDTPLLFILLLLIMLYLYAVYCNFLLRRRVNKLASYIIFFFPTKTVKLKLISRGGLCPHICSYIFVPGWYHRETKPRWVLLIGSLWSIIYLKIIPYTNFKGWPMMLHSNISSQFSSSHW